MSDLELGHQTKALYDQYFYEIVGWLRNQGANDYSEDLATEAFLRCWNIERKTQQKISKGYLYCAANSVWVSWIRSRAADKVRAQNWAEQHQAPIVDPPFIEEPSEILAQLTPIQAKIALWRSEDYSYPEISEMLAQESIYLSPEACKRKLFTVRYRLRKKYLSSKDFRNLEESP